jgi:hypothetical protein
MAAANHRLLAQSIQKSSGRSVAIILWKIARIRKFVSGSRAASFGVPPVFCWKAAGKYQGGRAQEIVLSDRHFGE